MIEAVEVGSRMGNRNGNAIRNPNDRDAGRAAARLKHCMAVSSDIDLFGYCGVGGGVGIGGIAGLQPAQSD
jgi:hypothetical protein